jgi:hypothetical protein
MSRKDCRGCLGNLPKTKAEIGYMVNWVDLCQECFFKVDKLARNRTKRVQK